MKTIIYKNRGFYGRKQKTGAYKKAHAEIEAL